MCHVCERAFNVSGKSINPCKSAQSKQADTSRNVLLFVKFLQYNGCMNVIIESTIVIHDGLIDRMVFYAVFNSISVISRQQLTLFMSFLDFTSTRLGLCSVLPKDTPTEKKKNPEDPEQLEPRNPGLRFKH